jgi:hypothetical protein
LSIGRDYGTALEVLQGLKPDDWIVLNPPDSLDEGVQVNVKEQQQPPAPANANPAPGNVPPNANGKPQQGDKK